MLMKANSTGELDRMLRHWRAMMPHWNTEADRLRLAARAGGTAFDLDEGEALADELRRAMAFAEALMSLCPPGDGRFSGLVQVVSDGEALLESCQTSLERLREAVPVDGEGRSVHRIAHAGVAAS